MIVPDNKARWQDEVRTGTLVSLRTCEIRNSPGSFCSARSRKAFRLRWRWEIVRALGVKEFEANVRMASPNVVRARCLSSDLPETAGSVLVQQPRD
jgi:hypothetical protein